MADIMKDWILLGRNSLHRRLSYYEALDSTSTTVISAWFWRKSSGFIAEGD